MNPVQTAVAPSAAEIEGSTLVAYRLTCTVTGKSYIGVTKRRLSIRLNQHFAVRSTCRLLREAIAQYPREFWVVEIIGTAESYSDLLGLEKQLIAKFGTKDPNGYNLTSGGQGVCGVRHRVSDEVRKRLSDYFRGRKRPPEVVEKLRQAMLRRIAQGRGMKRDGTAKRLSDIQISNAYFGAGKYSSISARFGVTKSAIGFAVCRVRRRLAQILEATSPLYLDVTLPRRIHPDWTDLAV